MDHHSHGGEPHPADISALEEFRVILEERPDQADRIMQRSTLLLKVSRYVLETLALQMPRVQSGIPGPPRPDESLVSVAVRYGTALSAINSMGELLNMVSAALTDATGCADHECEDAWTRLLDPPSWDDYSDEDGDAGFMVPGFVVITPPPGANMNGLIADNPAVADLVNRGLVAIDDVPELLTSVQETIRDFIQRKSL
jgi:hypothetical protein